MALPPKELGSHDIPVFFLCTFSFLISSALFLCFPNIFQPPTQPSRLSQNHNLHLISSHSSRARSHFLLFIINQKPEALWPLLSPRNLFALPSGTSLRIVPAQTVVLLALSPCRASSLAWSCLLSRPPWKAHDSVTPALPPATSKYEQIEQPGF